MNTENCGVERYVGLLRCSTVGQVGTSIEQQRKIVDAYAQSQGWEKVGEIVLEGVTGSRPGARTDLDDLIERKRNKNDFELVVVQDTSRMTRAGTDEMLHIARTLASAGIRMVCVQGHIPDDDTGALILSVRAFTDQQHARAIAWNSTRGSVAALEEGRTAHSRRVPYGIDCLYADADGKALLVVRNLTGGAQEVRDPESGAVRMVLSAGAPFRKQKTQRVTYVPGDPARVEIVRRMFRRYYLDGVGTWTIALQLNMERVPSPSGTRWNQSTIHLILRNPVYTGHAFSNRRTNSVYHMRGQKAPLPSPVARQELLSRKRPATRFRPESDWVRVEYPHLADYLPEDVRAIAIERQREHLERQHGGRAAQPRRRPNSDYFLTGILRATTGAALSGCPKGRGTCRYYRNPRAIQAPSADRTSRALVRAEPVERAVLEVVQLVLRFVPNLRREVEQQVREVVRAEDADRRQLDDLRKQRDMLKRQVELAIAHADPDQPALFADAVAHLKQQHRQLSDRIVAVEEKVGAGSADIDTLVAQTLSGLSKLSDLFDTVPPTSLTELVRVLVPRLEVDLVTKDVTVEVALPACCDPTLLMGLASISAWRSGRQTHRAGPGFRFIFTLIWNNRSKTYERRVRVDWDWVETDWEKEVEAG